MESLNDKLKALREHVGSDRVVVMIIGLGSVGSYLLDYLLSTGDPALRIVVVGRDGNKLQTKVNIAMVAGLIREVNRSHVEICDGVDLNDVGAIRDAVIRFNPDFIINSSRAYPGLKYGSISWANVRAYGIWTPLAIKFARNVCEACDEAGSDALIINTSYSDAVIPWLKSAGKAYPDFGSGNLNHLIPRMRLAVAERIGARDYWNVDVCFAAGHFHDVCISKEGHAEGVKLPLKVFYQGEELEVPDQELYSACCIPMPTDQTRNMMNASSNYRIVMSIIHTIRTGDSCRLFIPGFDGEIGGYPVTSEMTDGQPNIHLDESVFSYEEMYRANRESMALDGIEDVREGSLVYTDTLLDKAFRAFGVRLPKLVRFEDIDKTAEFIINEIIIPHTSGLA